MKTSRITIIIVSILILSSLLSGCLGAGTATQVQIWPGLAIDETSQVGYVASGNRVFAFDLNTGVEKWRYPVQPEKNLGFSAPPVLTDDGQLVAGAYNKTVYSLDPQNGQQKWINQDATNRYYAGALPLNQNIYAPNIDHNLYAMDNTGKFLWKFTTGAALWSAPATDGKVIYLAGMDHNVYSLDPKTGAVVWQTEDLGGSLASTPTLSSDGRLYVGTFNSEVLALDAASGKVYWRTPVSGWVYSAPVLENGILYFGDLNGTFYAMDAASGKIKWQTQPDTSTNRAISGAPAVIGDAVYFGSKAGIVYSLEKATGTMRWSSIDKPCCSNNGKTTLGKLFGPTLSSGDTLFLTPMGIPASVVAIDTNGNQKWSFTPAK